MEKERITKEEFKERPEKLIGRYDWSYADERQHAMSDI